MKYALAVLVLSAAMGRSRGERVRARHLEASADAGLAMPMSMSMALSAEEPVVDPRRPRDPSKKGPDNPLKKRLDMIKDLVEGADGPGKEVIGGTTVARKDLPPYLASLGWYTPMGDQHGCGATLIAESTVLTAAHCAGTFDYIDFGRYDLSGGLEGVDRRELCRAESAEDCDGLSYTVVHPGYSPEEFANDLALIFLNEPVSGNATPIMLNDDKKLPSSLDPLAVYGWGFTELGYPDLPQTTELFYIPNKNCVGGEPFAYPRWLISDDMLCAWDYGSGSCFGDSGGPIVIEEPGECAILAGITSFVSGLGCASSGYPGGFSRVSAGFDWITKTACRANGDLCEERKSGKAGKAGKGGKAGKAGKGGKAGACRGGFATVKPLGPTTGPTTYPPTYSPTTYPPTTSVGPTYSPTTYPPTTSVAPTSPCAVVRIKIRVKTDNWPGETTWKLTDPGDTSTFAERADFPNPVSVYLDELCLPEDEYLFTIGDSAGDGICCDYGKGFYEILVNGELVRRGGEFEFSESTLFNATMG